MKSIGAFPDKRLPWALGAVGAIGALLIALSLSRALEYDEAWTLLYFVPLSPWAVLNDLATPNNHPLNTLLMQWVQRLGGDSPLVLRLPNFLVWTGMMWLGVRFLQKRGAGAPGIFCGTAALAWSGILLHYAGTARGYAIQSCGILLAMIAMQSLMRNDRDRRAAIGLCSGALLTLFAVSSGALLVTALAMAGFAAYLLPCQGKNFWREHWHLWTCGALFALVVLVWFLPHWAALQEARRFGTPLRGAGEYFAWAWSILWNLRLAGWLGLALIALLWGNAAVRRDAWFTLLFPAFALLLSIFTNAGPERVYTALVPVTVVMGVLTLDRAFAGKWRMAALVLAALSSAAWVNFDVARLEGPDWGTVASRTLKFPRGVLPVFRTGDSFPAVFNCPAIADDYVRRLGAGRLTHLAAIAPPEGKFEGADRKWAPETFAPSANGVTAGRIHRADVVVYDLRPISADSPVQGKTLLLQVANKIQPQVGLFFAHPAIADEKSAYLECNLFWRTPAGAPVSCAWLLPQARHPAADYLRAAGIFGQGVVFYEVLTPQGNATELLQLK